MSCAGMRVYSGLLGEGRVSGRAMSVEPEPTPPENWVQVMTAVARDEIDHLAIVSRLLSRRGGTLTKHHRNAYATGRGRIIVRALAEIESLPEIELVLPQTGRIDP